MITFKFKNEKWPSDLRRLLEQQARRCPQVNERAIRRLTNDIRSELAKGIRSKQSRYAIGHLMRSIRAAVHKSDGKITEASVGTPVEYMPYLEGGTQAHMVRPTRAKALSWRIQGGASASKAKKWIGRAFSKGHMVSGIRAWGVFAQVTQWAKQRAKEIYADEISRLKK